LTPGSLTHPHNWARFIPPSPATSYHGKGKFRRTPSILSLKQAVKRDGGARQTGVIRAIAGRVYDRRQYANGPGCIRQHPHVEGAPRKKPNGAGAAHMRVIWSMRLSRRVCKAVWMGYAGCVAAAHRSGPEMDAVVALWGERAFPCPRVTFPFWWQALDWLGVWLAVLYSISLCSNL
jgi:hypothetical protein